MPNNPYGTVHQPVKIKFRLVEYAFFLCAYLYLSGIALTYFYGQFLWNEYLRHENYWYVYFLTYSIGFSGLLIFWGSNLLKRKIFTSVQVALLIIMLGATLMLYVATQRPQFS